MTLGPSHSKGKETTLANSRSRSVTTLLVKSELINMAQSWDKEKVWVPESNPWPPRHWVSPVTYLSSLYGLLGPLFRVMFCFCSVPATGLCEVSLADRILSFSELDPSITPSKLHDARVCNCNKGIMKYSFEVTTFSTRFETHPLWTFFDQKNNLF